MKVAEIITENYELVYYDAENVGFIGILAYPKKYFVLYLFCIKSELIKTLHE